MSTSTKDLRVEPKGEVTILVTDNKGNDIVSIKYIDGKIHLWRLQEGLTTIVARTECNGRACLVVEHATDEEEEE